MLYKREYAEVAQLVEHHPSRVTVMGSKPIFRSDRLGSWLRLLEAAHLGDGLTPVEVRILPPPLSHLRLKPPQGFNRLVDTDPSWELLMLRLAGVTSKSRAPLHTNPVALPP